MDTFTAWIFTIACVAVITWWTVRSFYKVIDNPLRLLSTHFPGATFDTRVFPNIGALNGVFNGREFSIDVRIVGGGKGSRYYSFEYQLHREKTKSLPKVSDEQLLSMLRHLSAYIPPNVKALYGTYSVKKTGASWYKSSTGVMRALDPAIAIAMLTQLERIVVSSEGLKPAFSAAGDHVGIGGASDSDVSASWHEDEPTNHRLGGHILAAAFVVIGMISARIVAKGGDPAWPLFIWFLGVAVVIELLMYFAIWVGRGISVAMVLVSLYSLAQYAMPSAHETRGGKIAQSTGSSLTPIITWTVVLLLGTLFTYLAFRRTRQLP